MKTGLFSEELITCFKYGTSVASGCVSGWIARSLHAFASRARAVRDKSHAIAQETKEEDTILNVEPVPRRGSPASEL